VFVAKEQPNTRYIHSCHVMVVTSQFVYPPAYFGSHGHRPETTKATPWCRSYN